MKQIANGQYIPLSNGTTAVVRAFLGEGGQGAVFVSLPLRTVEEGKASVGDIY